MKLTVRCYDLEFEIQTKTVPTHALLDDHPELQDKLKTAICLVIEQHVAPKDPTTT